MSTTVKNRETIQKIVGTGVLMALVIVLQVFASGIRIGNLSLTFSLVPIVIGAVLYGPAVGALLGGVVLGYPAMEARPIRRKPGRIEIR